MQLEELLQIIQVQENLMNDIKKGLKIEEKEKTLTEIEIFINHDNAWNDPLFQSKMQEKKTIEKILHRFHKAHNAITDAKEFISLEDESMIEDVKDILNQNENLLEELRILSMFSGECDKNDAFLEINAGAGGTDSQDWAEMMLRMYSMWADNNDFKFTIKDRNDGEEAGIKNVTVQVQGEFAYGWLKNEIGVHRLVRISPFNSNGKRQTSFASVFVYPSINDSIKIDIKESDLKIDTYRSSGPGGQSVNTTDSAVRITHIPTNIITQSQNQRSQIQNREEAMSMLKSKLYEYELRKKQEEIDKANSSKKQISFGSQIRNYVLHPYQLVKDLRSNYETSRSDLILNGDLNNVMKSVLLIG